MFTVTEVEINRLCTGTHSDPFSVLGLHPLAQGWVVRALLPSAERVEVVVQGKVQIALTKHPHDDFFEGLVPRRKKRFSYSLRITWQGETRDFADPYAFGSSIEPSAMEAFHHGRHARAHEFLGAHPMVIDQVAGVRFAVWAPNAMRVSVIGDFNAWNGAQHPMRLHHGVGIWEIFIPHAKIGEKYQFQLLDQTGKRLPHKSDPFAFWAELRPAQASVIVGLPKKPEIPLERAQANQRNQPLSIYEMHLGSWKQCDGRWLTWEELADTLPAYVANLGFTHVEFMPISEHPFDGSWGYQSLGYFAPTARFGKPEGLRQLVSALHAQGIGVIIDWVPAHFPTDAHGLAQFDGTALYEYADRREGYHPDWHTLIFNYARAEVRCFLVSSAVYWLEYFGVDGLRVDAVSSMLYRDYSRNAGEWLPNFYGGRENLEAISLLQYMNGEVGQNFPHAITLAEESTAYPRVSAPVTQGGLGFHYKWNMGWMHDTLKFMHHDPIHRAYHHDSWLFSLVYAYSENFVLPFSHDEVVHGKGSMLQKMPGDEWQKRATLRALYGYMWAHPGKKLLFMGGEFAQWREWNDQSSLDWFLLENAGHAGISRLIRDLNLSYRHTPALYANDHHPSGFNWVITDAHTISTIAFLRWSPDRSPVLILCHLTPVVRPSFLVGIPDVGVDAWQVILNTDAEIYGGSGVGEHLSQYPLVAVENLPNHHQPCSLRLTISPLATVYLSPRQKAKHQVDGGVS